ncbi:hypothetical protein [Streptomyces sp. fd1-xmd]|uniref:hypothetical protein n=1 Tax=Streptomyces sp. fd1-xmd TaxID=1812480 RepID=UPI0009903F22|nr:hypothetical protein [Streptomyces sp. fd1-xmd]AQT70395.1 hypothetical protein B1K54_00225 [Streptomyces sp. fd1-xmd]
MARIEKALVVGAALLLLIAGCDGGAGSDADSSRGSHNVPLSDLESISIADDPLTDTDGPVRILSEIRYEHGRLIAYVKGESCGIVAASGQDAEGEKIDLTSEWPRGDEGSNTYPAGPYNSVSGAGGAKTWASMLCGRNAMVIEYSASQAGAPGQSRGQTAVAQVPGQPTTSRIIVGAPGTRDQIQQRPAG